MYLLKANTKKMGICCVWRFIVCEELSRYDIKNLGMRTLIKAD